MSRQRIKAFFVRLIEAVIALALVLVAFSIIMLMINKLFPSGSGLAGILDRKSEKLAVSKHNLHISSGDYEASLANMDGLAAVLDQTDKSVKRKASDGIAWNTVVGGTALFDRDAVQTFNGASAEIVFDKSSRLTMGANSLIIIQRMEKDLFRNERRSQVMVVDGELSGTISGAGQLALQVEVATPNAVARINGGDDTAQFSVKVNPDKSSTLTVVSGQAELISMGKSIIVEANQSATAEQGAAPRKVMLPAKVSLVRPPDQKKFIYRELPPLVKFEWKTLKEVTGYRIQIARDKAFTQVVVDETVSKTIFSHGNLHQGNYFWRIKALQDWAEGEYSAVQLLSIEQDKVPPALEVLFPQKMSELSTITLNGSTEKNAQLLVNGQVVKPNEEGDFAYVLQLQQGVNVLVVEAIDVAGNVTYKSGMVYGKF